MTTKNVSFFQQQDPSAIRNQLLAERLAKLAEPTPNEAVGGIVVKKSPLEFLAKSIASYGADRAQEKVYQAQLDAQNKRSQMLAQFLGVDGGMQGGGGSNPRASLYGQLLAVDPSGELAIKQKMEDAALTDMQKNSGWMGVTPEQQRSAWRQDAFKEPLKSGLQANVDPQGNITAAPVPGVLENKANETALLKQIEEQNRANFDLVDVPQADGTVKKMTRANAALAAGGGPFVLPTPKDNNFDVYGGMPDLPLNKPNADPYSFKEDIGGSAPPVKPSGSALPGIDTPNPRTLDTQQKAQEGLNADFISGSYRPAINDAQIARDSSARLEALRNIDLTNSTGWGTETKAAIGNVLAGMGIAPADVQKYTSDAQAFKAIVSQAVNQDLLAQKGPQTEGDAQRAYNIQAKLGNTPEANQFIIDMAQAVNNLKIRKADFYSQNIESAQKSGNLANLDAVWSQQAPSIFDDPLMKKYASQNATGSGGGSDDIKDLLQYMTPEERALFQQ